MVKYVTNLIMGLIVVSLVKADEENYDATTCYNIYCENEEKCCSSRTNGAVCCPPGSICDSEFGCIGSSSNVSKTNVEKECPPLSTECFDGIIFDICCPLPFAECCSDLIHCCPGGYECCQDMIHCCLRGYECDLENKRCIKKDNIEINSRIFKRNVPTVNLSMKKCGDEVWCPKEDDCCQDKNGGWKCCREFSKGGRAL